MKEEKMYDFGELGKWSENTLLANWKYMPNYSYDDMVMNKNKGLESIDSLYREKKQDYVDSIKKINKKKYFFFNMKDFYSDFLLYQASSVLLNKLEKSYSDYNFHLNELVSRQDHVELKKERGKK
jgi:hypothetical protein